MAAVTDVQTVNITINGIEMKVPKGELIVESIKAAGLDVPIFCYHPRMKPVGMCRMCLVEMGSKGPDGSVRMMPKPQTACSLPATEGLVIVTDSPRIHQDRKGVLEFLLVNHPLDCPVCDRGGECPLQNNTLYYGPSTSRFIEVKRHAPKAFPLSKYVTLDLERCIQCGRCVRFTEEISGDAQLAFRFRGASMQPSTFELRDFNSKFSGNVIEICPVGALTNTTYRFRARPWDIQTRPAVCTNCGNGCNIFIDYRDQTLVRVNGRTNEQVNEEWTCDRGKFGHGFYNSDRRMERVLLRDGARLTPSSWVDAYAKIVGELKQNPTAAAVIGGSANSNEDVFALGTLFSQGLKSANLSFFGGFNQPIGQDAPQLPAAIASYESAKAVLIFGSSLADEEPILYLRIRKAWLNHGTKVVIAHSAETDADGFADAVLRYFPGTESALLLALGKEITFPGSDLDGVEAETGVSKPEIRRAADLLRGAGAQIVSTRRLLHLPNAEEITERLDWFSESAGATINSYALVSNGMGAELIARGLGFTAQTAAILKACVTGQVKFLWVIGEDLLDYPDQKLVADALESVDFLVVQDVIQTELTSYASLVLPMSGPAESDGTWTNIEGRVQAMKAVLTVRGESKTLWQVASDVGMRLGATAPIFSAQDALTRLSRVVPSFAGVTWEELPLEGHPASLTVSADHSRIKPPQGKEHHQSNMSNFEESAKSIEADHRYAPVGMAVGAFWGSALVAGLTGFAMSTGVAKGFGIPTHIVGDHRVVFSNDYVGLYDGLFLTAIILIACVLLGLFGKMAVDRKESLSVLWRLMVVVPVGTFFLTVGAIVLHH